MALPCLSSGRLLLKTLWLCCLIEPGLGPPDTLPAPHLFVIMAGAMQSPSDSFLTGIKLPCRWLCTGMFHGKIHNCFNYAHIGIGCSSLCFLCASISFASFDGFLSASLLPKRQEEPLTNILNIISRNGTLFPLIFPYFHFISPHPAPSSSFSVYFVSHREERLLAGV